MEATGMSASSAVIAGSSSEVSTPAAYEDDSASRHFAITASQVPKPTGGIPSAPGAGSASSSEMAIKDGKSHGTRFHEDCFETDLPSPKLRSSRLYKGKGKEAVKVEVEKKKPLQLLDLPVDILKDIVREVTHTNDLTSLALCHSALHHLTTPHIYSRFDIVWPDTNTHAEPRSGVDALTYGLATLVMAEEIFGEAPEQRRDQANRYNRGGQGMASDMTVRRRRGNHYAQFTRKFSLGNGPADWVQEYLITKEGGKMLGTLVALAVARMRALETFIWDMPTGILRDVWLALSSLGDRYDGRPCRLEKVWVRWHDNSSAEASSALPPPPPPPMGVNAPQGPIQTHMLNTTPAASPSPPVPPGALDRVEHPSFSVLPSLKSLSVLDIDELSYLDEMAVLIGRSLEKLKELRVGIARHAISGDWVTVWEGDNVRQVDPHFPTAASLTIGEKRLGGVLGTLTGFVCDMRKPKVSLPDRTKRRPHVGSSSRSKSPVMTPPSSAVPATPDVEPLIEQSSTLSGITSLRDVLSEAAPAEPPPESSISPEPQSIDASDAAFENDPLVAQSSDASSPLRTPALQISDPMQNAIIADHTAQLDETEPEPGPEEHYLDNKLQLESLELERVPLSIPVLQKAIDWSRLTSLTLLHCHNHEQLWKTLRRTFAPVPRSPTYPHPRRTSGSTPKKRGSASVPGSDIELDYGLKLKKIHTNTVSPALISFLKDTLAPNSLEVLFLQEARSYSSSVTVDQIFKGPLRRHRNSLKKILVDSSEKGPDGVPTNSSRWRRWLLSKDILAFICSGKMPVLKELGMAIDYRDWHYFLQHLPSIPHLRSLSIPFLADHVHGSNLDPRELALQIVDIVALRPEVELCYMGIASKCFEILENRRRTSSSSDDQSEAAVGIASANVEEEDEDAAAGSEDEDEDDEAEDTAGSAEDLGSEAMDTESDEDHDDEDDTDSDEDSMEFKRVTARFRLREILFYDDKVAIFKARHGRL